jgi:alpha-beta hydrolase superfamily lysophospholipase
MPPFFELLGLPRQVRVMAIGRAIRNLRRLERSYGVGRWRKCKGEAIVRLADGSRRRAEVHWYEADGIGRVEVKIKRYLPT